MKTYSIFKLYLKLIFRNNRVLPIVPNMFFLVLICYWQYVLAVSKSLYLLEIGFLFILVIVPGFVFSMHAYRYMSINFDLISTWPLSLTTLNNAIWLITLSLTSIPYVVLFIIALTIDVEVHHIIDHLFLPYIFTMGVTTPVYIFVGTYQNNRFDISASAFSLERVVVQRLWLYYLATLLIGIFIMGFNKLLSYYLGEYGYKLSMLFLSVIGVTSWPYLNKKISKNTISRIHDIRKGFRKL